MSKLVQLVNDFIARVHRPEVWSDVDGVHTSGSGGVTLCDVVAPDGMLLNGFFEVSVDSHGNEMSSRLLVPCDVNGKPEQDSVMAISTYGDTNLTPGDVNFELYKFFPPDGKVIEYLREQEIRVCLISGRNSACVADRARKLDAESYLGEKDKLKRILALSEVPLSDIIFFGYHIQDVEAMLAIKEAGGLTVAPADATPEAHNAATYISTRNGGEGVLAEFFQVYLKERGWWPDGY